MNETGDVSLDDGMEDQSMWSLNIKLFLAIVSGDSESDDGDREEETEEVVDETITELDLEQDPDDEVQPTMVRLLRDNNYYHDPAVVSSAICYMITPRISYLRCR